MSRTPAADSRKIPIPKKVQSHDENGLMDVVGDRKPRNGRYYKPQYSPTSTIDTGLYKPQYSPTSTDTGLSASPPYTNGNGRYKAPMYSPTSSIDAGTPQPTNGWDFSELEMRYTGMINSLKDELGFLEESNSNLLVELRESQDSNYVLTEELRRLQRTGINTLDELQACQTANTVLRQELQRLEQASVKMTRDSEKYKKANSMLKDEIKDLKANQSRRKTSMVTLKEKAKDLQKDIMEKEKDFKELSSLKQTVNIIIEAVEMDNNDNGYCPTDSDSASTDGNDDQHLGAFTPKPVKRSDTFSGPIPSPLARKFFQNIKSPDLRRKQDSLFGKRQKDLFADFTERSRSRSLNISNTGGGDSRDQTPSPPDLAPPAVSGRRRGSLDSFNKEIKETSLRNDTLTRLLGKSLEKLNDHKIRRSDSNTRPRSMTFDFNDNTEHDLRRTGDRGPPINSSPEKGTFEL